MVDDSNKAMWVYLPEEKSEVINILKDFITMIFGEASNHLETVIELNLHLNLC